MKFIFKLSFLLAFIVGVSSCQFQSKSEFTVAEINTYPTLEENKQIAKNILKYPFEKLIEEGVEITDSTIMNGISIKSRTKEDKVIINLILTGEAISHSENIVSYLSLFLEEKIELYKANVHFLQNAQLSGGIILDLMKNNAQSIIWEEASPSFHSLVSQKEFEELVSKFSQNFNFNQKRTLDSQLIGYVKNVKNVTVALHYTYEDGTKLEVSLENINDEAKLLGFRMLEYKGKKI